MKLIDIAGIVLGTILAAYSAILVLAAVAYTCGGCA